MSSIDNSPSAQQKDSGKAISLSPRLAKAFEGIEQWRPMRLSEKHPRILQKLNSLWPAPACISYIDELMLHERQKREGFEPDVLREILFLKQLHMLIYPAGFSDIDGDFDRAYQTTFHPQTLDDIIGQDEASIAALTPELRRIHAEAVRSLLEHAHWGEIETLEELQAFWTRKNTPGLARSSRLGEIFVDFNLLGEDAVSAALDHQSYAVPRPKLGHILVDARLCTSQDVRKALSHQARMALVNLDKIAISEDALKVIDVELATRIRAVPLAKIDGVLFVAVENPLFFPNKDELKFSTKMQVELVCAHPSAVSRRLARYSAGTHVPSHSI